VKLNTQDVRVATPTGTSPSSDLTASSAQVPQPPVTTVSPIRAFLQSRGSSAGLDKAFGGLMVACALAIFAIVALILFELIMRSQLSISKFGLKFFFTQAWDPVSGQFGALPFIYGTLVSSLLGLLIAVPLAIGVAIFLTEMCPKLLRGPLSFLTELLAAIPSVVYGLWAVFILVPLLREHVNPVLAKLLGWTGFFGGPNYGIGMLAAGVILAIMILPVISSLTREVMTSVPHSQREAVLALGATRWEMIRMGVLRNARIGIVGAIILGLGRALGETMAVTMVIGNRPEIAKSLFAPGYSMASVIANEFSEASDDLYLSALVEIGLALFLVTIVVNALARLLVWAVTRGTPARVV
jgi:phosphate transport system permease protein